MIPVWKPEYLQNILCILFLILIGVYLLYNVVSFFCTTKSISHMHTYTHSLLDVLFTPPSHPSYSDVQNNSEITCQ